MRKIHLYMTVLPGLLALFGVSCSKAGLEVFNSNSSIYFDNTLNQVTTDSSDVSFAYADSSVTDTVVSIRVSVTGVPVSKDRPYKVSVDALSTAVAGKHYDKLPGTFFIPAGRLFDSIRINMHRTPDIKDIAVSLVLDLEANDQFMPDILLGGSGADAKPLSMVTYRIKLSDILVPPAGWAENIFGRFSPKKMGIICRLGDVTPVWLNTGDAQYPLNSLEFSLKCYYLAELLSAYLVEQRNAGTPVYYEDGVTEMSTGD